MGGFTNHPRPYLELAIRYEPLSPSGNRLSYLKKMPRQQVSVKKFSMQRRQSRGRQSSAWPAISCQSITFLMGTRDGTQLPSFSFLPPYPL
ncbi:hypothetical protein PoB_002741900 [Plakobranchus ocellatus]|uniref:Uncharacterized protein n=1 Tax=Plakobranchus ocellatus TaxID=259542 RepID=A0AAV4A402_9GAST|nr:hypothetical protein PoB_002741900 [Plakobranchus ocellatus]